MFYCIHYTVTAMAFNGEASGDMVHDKGNETSGIAAEAHLMLATLSAILMDLSESYHAIVHGAGGCLGGLFRVGELDLVVQEALAAYERQVLRRDVMYGVSDDDDDDSGDVCDWVGLLSRRIEGRVRRRSSFLTDLKVTDWRPSASDGKMYTIITLCLLRFCLSNNDITYAYRPTSGQSLQVGLKFLSLTD